MPVEMTLENIYLIVCCYDDDFLVRYLTLNELLNFNIAINDFLKNIFSSDLGSNSRASLDHVTDELHTCRLLSVVSECALVLSSALV